ncbi:MAG: discoidin domain-containing protein [Planctomycetes bacterium]|nr:discoidin domain-containing protein [Planctomycetota bacterium]
MDLKRYTRSTLSCRSMDARGIALLILVGTIGVQQARSSSRPAQGTPAATLDTSRTLPRSRPAEPGSASSVTREQIEADWLRQNALRGWARGVDHVEALREDAAGGCDGIKNGGWGFHTAKEQSQWWQVDLGEQVPIGEVRVFNRCDAMAGRASRLLVLLSDDSSDWRQVYQHDGTTFYGFSDGKPLSVRLEGQAARYVRLQLPGHEYFHLDEIEVYPAGGSTNVALGKPANQSSVNTPFPPGHFYTEEVISRGLRLAASLENLGLAAAPARRALGELRGRLNSLGDHTPPKARRDLFLEANWVVRKLALSNPLLDFDRVLFIKRAPGMLPHMSDQFYGWWSRPGGGIYILEGFKDDSPRLRCLTQGWSAGSFLLPELSFDAKKLLFAYCRYYPHIAGTEKADKTKLPEDAFYHIFEMNVDTGEWRRLTSGRYDDFNARCLPNGEIVFLSTRKGQAIHVDKTYTSATSSSVLPDSFVRCGGDNHRPVPVFTLHAMNADGEDLRPISAFENFEWFPSVASDGRILYARWDYIDRFNGPFMSLWSTNPDGTNAQLVYGNYTKSPQCIFEASAIPNSRRLVFTASAHHSITGGALALLDRTRGTEGQASLTRLTPEVCYPEAEGWRPMYYASPFPLSEEHFLVSWSDRPLPPHAVVKDDRNPVNASGIYLYDAFGSLTLLHRDPAISSVYPIAMRPRPRPTTLANHVDWSRPRTGRFLVQDVYQGLAGIERGTVKRIRVIAVPPKVQPHMNTPSLGISKEEPGKYVLGTAPVEADGSTLLEVPAGVPVMFQALNGDGLAIQTMRSLTYVQPGQTLSCIGCHESREAAPKAGRIPLAAARGTGRLTPGPEGSWPLRYDRLVQPVLDRQCVSCHSPRGGQQEAVSFDLTADKSYDSLMSYADGDLSKRAFERDASLVGDCVAQNSKLLEFLTRGDGHQGVRLDPESFERLVTWMDLYAPIRGSFSEEQEERLLQMKEDWQGRLSLGDGDTAPDGESGY